MTVFYARVSTSSITPPPATVVTPPSSWTAHTFYVGDGQWLVHSGCFSNQLPLALKAELATASRAGLAPILAGTPEFDALIASGQPVKYVMLTDGTILFAPDVDAITHAALAGEQDVRAARTINVADDSTSGYWVTDLTNNSGHYTPDAASLADASTVLGNNRFTILPGSINPYLP